MGRTSDNVYDKYRSIGEEGTEERVKSLWKFREIVTLLLEVEKQTEIEFIDHSIFSLMQIWKSNWIMRHYTTAYKLRK